jgi:hypothetical protein
MGERGVGDDPAVVHPAHHFSFGQRVREEHLVELGGSVGLRDAHLDAVLAHRHEEIRDSGVLRRKGVRAGEQEDVVGELGLRGPDLLAVDDPLVAVEHRARLQTGEVGAAVGLAETLAPSGLAAQDLGEELLLLLLGAPLEDRGPDQRIQHRDQGAGSYGD